MANEQTPPAADTTPAAAGQTTPTVETPPIDNNGNDPAGSGKGSEDLKNLSTEKLAELLLETRGEAKTRRLKQRELEEKITGMENDTKLAEQAELEKSNEWKTAYEKLKENTKDYDTYKTFKVDSEKRIETEVEKLSPSLTKEENELYELSSKSMAVTDKLIYINKLISTRPGTTNPVDNTQSTGRTGTATEPAVTVPFGNSQGVIGKAMEMLTNLGKK